MVNEMDGKFKFMNLIFIYFSKRMGGGYWRGALVRRNMVNIKEEDVMPAYGHLGGD